MKKVRVSMAVFLLCVATAASGVDSFRVRATTLLTVDSQTPEPQTLELGYNDALGILVSPSAIFVKGLEIEVKVPQELLAYRNSMAYGLYRQVQPAPAAGAIDYQGEQISLQPFPPKISFVLQLPLQKGHNLKTGPYSTVIPYVHDAAKGPILFRILPVMKGLPDNIESMRFIVRVKPILATEGGMQLRLTYPTESAKPVSVRVDEALVSAIEEPLILSPGDHHLSIVSDDYRNEVRVFTVESARITELSVRMKDTTPRLQCIAPEGTILQLDAKPIENDRAPIVVEPGEHTVLFRIGDYEISKQVVVEKGRDYTISMIIDLTIQENP